MLRVVTPSPWVDTYGLLVPGLVGHRLMTRAAVVQVARSDTYGFLDGDQLIAAIGFHPLPEERQGEELVEVWFVCRPDMGRHMVSFVKLAHLTCRRIAQHGDVRIRAFVREGHKPGQRIARLVGFSLEDVAAGFERWEWRACHEGDDGKMDQEHVRAKRAGGAGRANPAGNSDGVGARVGTRATDHQPGPTASGNPDKRTGA